jgi:serine/threonine protein kinase
MGKVFTITEGLENMGALKTGGQGSVYKGRRIGEIITAVKLLPTPIHTESVDDKNFKDFQNEVEKLKRVNEDPNPHVVKILSSGITETGSFPFIEMEFIEGPDLEELLKPPHTPVFTIKEAIKVADQLSQALAHCHKLDVRHGDIKSNNVKYNRDTGNYVLLDFGLAVMSDEQRRTSLRHAGAIEFMAPEQNEGAMLFQTDVYGFGIILFELLAGSVPFPLTDKGETARNLVRLSHIETQPPDLLEWRRERLAAEWSDDKKERESQVPDWVLAMIYKCLEKNPEARFANGIELHEYIALNSTLTANKVGEADNVLVDLQNENTKLLNEKTQLQSLVLQQRESIDQIQEEVASLKKLITNKDTQIATLSAAPAATERYAYDVEERPAGISKSAFYTVLFIAIALAAFTIYSLLNRSASSNNVVSGVDTSVLTDTSASASLGDSSDIAEVPKTIEQQRKKTLDSARRVAANQKPEQVTEEEGEQANDANKTATEEPATNNQTAETNNNTKTESSGRPKYAVISKAYFHSEPDEDARREAFIVHWNNAKLTALEEQNGFIYVVFTNHLGQTSKGWLRKKDLRLLDE